MNIGKLIYDQEFDPERGERSEKNLVDRFLAFLMRNAIQFEVILFLMR